MTGYFRRLRRLGSDTRGAMAVMLALSLVPLSIAALGAADLTHALSVRSQLQDSLDAATLAAARTVTPQSSPPAPSDLSALKQVGGDNLVQNLGQQSGFTLVSRDFSYGPDGPSLVIGDASAEVNTLLAKLVLGGKPLQVSAHSEVNSAANNIELSMVLDVTGSMGQSGAIADLKVGAKQLVDLVVRPPNEQKPYYSKIALVPYSYAVNAGSQYADYLRGPLSSGDCFGCTSYSFTPASGGWTTFYGTTCVTERTTTAPGTTNDHRYDDAAFDVAPRGAGWVGRHYARSGCGVRAITPLTSDKTKLKGEIDALTTEGSTAGHIGLAWGWYLVSPRFLANAAPILGDSMPAAYGTKRLYKVVVLMTDGVFNTAYANGVVSKDTFGDGGSGSSYDHINRTADNGDPYTQAKTLCDAMKAKGIIVYTVGYFQGLSGTLLTASQNLMSYCASKPSNAYLPGNGTDLRTAFQEIGRDVASLRISK